MLQRLYIRNYAIISELEVHLHPGLTIVTGETGAGKSILLGALALVLGKRADSSVLYDEESKCIVEAEFDTTAFPLDDFFNENDIDREAHTTLRREINAQGKSRAFINDTPVNLPQLKELAERLVDVHSQHEVHTLKETAFRARFLDACADGGRAFQAYSVVHAEWHRKRKRLSLMEDSALKLRADEDYLRFQLDELEQLQLTEGELANVEQSLVELEHAEEIRTTLASVTATLSNGDLPVLDVLRQVASDVARLSRNYSKAEDWAHRIQSALIDIEDIANDMEHSVSAVEDNPDELERLQERSDLIHRLLSKHRKHTEMELLAFQSEIADRLSNIDESDEELEALRKEMVVLEAEMMIKANELSVVRSTVAAGMGERLTKELHLLGMPDATLHFSINSSELTALGQDNIQVLFSANKGQPMHDVSKVASGGELSRLMLVIKAEMASNAQLPVIIFDEIDTGVSGDVADKMGHKIKELSRFMQVLCITHLPQIAAKGNQHLFVFKEDENRRTVTRIRALDHQERVVEIAKMLSNDSPTEAALIHAKHLVEQA
jgi:DNA repair protein RecN (Recombination protein N)